MEVTNYKRESLWELFVSCITTKFMQFSGRARRREYWGFMLFRFILLVFILTGFFIGRSEPGEEGVLYSILIIVLTVFYIGFLIPEIAVGVRRLHDIGKDGAWICINFIPTVGSIIFLVFSLMDSEPFENRYGDDPKRFERESFSQESTKE